MAKRSMKWVAVILGLGIIRGVVFPDYRFGANIVVIPFVMPFFLAAFSVYLGATKRLTWTIACVCSLASVYLSTLIGIVVFGFSVGWENITDDRVSQAVFMTTFGVQTLMFAIGLGVSWFIAKRYNKHM